MLSFLLALPLAGPPQAMAGSDFFEKEIRPLLVEKCLSCHGEKKPRGGLRLLSREAILRGGLGGPAVRPGKPEQSLLIQAVEYLGEPKMPPKGKLSSAEINRLKRWVAMGTPWPDAGKTVAEESFRITDTQRRWWAFQPLRDRLPPGGGSSPVDAFLLNGPVGS